MIKVSKRSFKEANTYIYSIFHQGKKSTHITQKRVYIYIYRYVCIYIYVETL